MFYPTCWFEAVSGKSQLPDLTVPDEYQHHPQGVQHDPQEGAGW